MSRGFTELTVTWPKFLAEESWAANAGSSTGLNENCGWLKVLKNSPRNSRLLVSRILISFEIDISQLYCPGERYVPRPMFPYIVAGVFAPGWSPGAIGRVQVAPAPSENAAGFR